MEKISTDVNGTSPKTKNSTGKYGRVDLADFVKEVDRFSRLIEPFAFVLYCLDDIRNWRYPKITLCLWIICNLCCIILTKGAVFVLVSLLVVVIAATGLVQIHTRILDKILPVNHLSNPDDESSDENDEDSAYSTVRQFRVSIIQMFEFVVKCNELLAHFYGILKWDNILPSLRFHIEFCTLLLSFVVLPTRWIYIALVNWVFLDNDIVIQLVIDNSQLFIGCLTGQALQSPVSKTVTSKEEIKSEEEVKDKKSSAKDSEDISDLDYDAETIEVTMDEDGKSPSTNKPGMVARLMELKKRRQHIANESCFACKVSFASILKRRFYCRHCGNNFCSKCCNQRVPKSVFGATAPSAQTETVLVCNTCHKNLTKAPDKDKKS
ncbi:protrudin-like [Mytilus trossulus]|uniref:protrudin-like n=1 Tax=Mytilus trossulus TaxID=6551 RepID=UPI0030077002